MRQAVLFAQRLSPSIWTAGVLIAVLLLAAPQAGATYVKDYSGNFTSPNDLFKIQFTLTKESTVSAETSSWGSRYSSYHNFDTKLWLFNPSTGALIDDNVTRYDNISQYDLDSKIEVNLGPGTYLFTLTTSPQVYSAAGWSNTGDFGGRGTGYAVKFISEACNSVDSINGWREGPPPSNTPEPASASLLLIGGALLGLRKFRRRTAR